MMAVAMRSQVEVSAPRSFVPPGDRAVRLSHLDPRPLRGNRPTPVSPWRSPSFYFACALVMPVAAVVAPLRYLLGR